MADPRTMQFSFEAEHGGSHRGGEQADRAYATLLRRLGVTADDLGDAEAERAIRKYVLEIPLNIAWYDAALRREQVYQQAFVVLTVALLVIALPLLGYLPVLALRANAEGDIIVAQITGILTGVFALQRSFGALLDRRKRVALFHEASAELKELLYSFEEQWRGRVLVDGEVDPKLVAALHHDVKSAQAIVKEERKKFFQNMQAAPTIELGPLLQRGASEGAAVTRAAATAGRTAQRESLQAVRTEANEQRAVVQTLERLLAEAKAEYEQLEADNSPLAATAKTNLSTISTKLRDAKIKLAESEARLS